MSENRTSPPPATEADLELLENNRQILARDAQGRQRRLDAKAEDLAEVAWRSPGLADLVPRMDSLHPDMELSVVPRRYGTGLVATLTVQSGAVEIFTSLLRHGIKAAEAVAARPQSQQAAEPEDTDVDIEGLRGMIDHAFETDPPTTNDGRNPAAELTLKEATARTLVEILAVMKSIDQKVGDR